MRAFHPKSSFAGPKRQVSRSRISLQASQVPSQSLVSSFQQTGTSPSMTASPVDLLGPSTLGN
jgi:hypothetical protein